MISAEQLAAVADWLHAHGEGADMEVALRAAFRDLHFTFCQDDDVMVDTPALRLPACNLYLVDSSNHCLCLTQDPERASGLVVAALDEP